MTLILCILKYHKRITQTNYAIKTKEHFDITYQYFFRTRINIKSEKSATNGIEPGLAATVYAS